MPETPFADLKLFITGPTYLRPQVRAAGTWPEFGHRDTENAKRFKPIFENLARIADLPDDYRTILFLGSGSTAMNFLLAVAFALAIRLLEWSAADVVSGTLAYRVLEPVVYMEGAGQAG